MNRTESRDAFAFEALDDGGVLLDLRSGQLRVLNRSAAFVWVGYLRGEEDEQLIEAFASTFRIDREIARRDVSACLAIQRTTEPSLAAGPTETGVPAYQRSAEGYCLSMDGTPLLEVSPTGGAIRLLTTLPPRELASYLRVLSPKLAAMRGCFVLHASAIRRHAREDVVAFCGRSGAGKTTTAHMFARAGCDLIAEDKLLLRPDGERLEVVLRGEQSLGTFMAELQPRLSARGHRHWIDIDPAFDKAADGEAGALAQVALLSAERRDGPDIKLLLQPLARACARLFENVFVGSDDPREWRRELANCARIARTTAIFDATVPRGVTALESAVLRYTTMTAS